MEEVLKKIGHNIDLKGFIIHRITKKQKEKGAILKLASTAIVPTDSEKRFISVVSANYYKKSGPTYGIFNDLESNKFRKSLEGYIAQQQNFVEFSHSAMKYYEYIIKDISAATGGFILFANYCDTDKQTEHLLIIAINNKDGYVFDEENLTLQNIKNIELSKIDLACLINITRWNEYKEGVNCDIKTYLSLVRGNKELSRYFMEFIGNENKTTSAESSTKLINALNQFCKLHKYSRDETMDIRNRVSSYCQECLNKKTEILLSTISALVDIEQPDVFKEFASSEDVGVDEIISGDATVLKRIRSIKHKDDRLTIEFYNQYLGKDIIYDPNNKQLTIKNIDLTTQIPTDES